VKLKERGKTVIVITHDDRYFHLADHMIKLEYGKVEQSAVLNRS
jgi:putative pyoverdin transport system ATP-binding/permease protein